MFHRFGVSDTPGESAYDIEQMLHVLIVLWDLEFALVVFALFAVERLFSDY